MFKVGDKVMIRCPDSYCPFTFTTEGARGTVTSIESDYDEVTVLWDYLPRWPARSPEHFSVGQHYLVLIDSIPEGKYGKIIHKIKQMEAKRKQLGYKTYGTI